MHHHKRAQNPQWQRNNRHQRGTEVKQKQRTHQNDDGELLQQFVRQRFDRFLNQLRSVVHRDNLHPFWQRFLQHAEFFFHSVKRFKRVLPVTHHHHAARNFTLAVKLRHTPTDLRPQADRRHVS
ncbi:hypothetical protein D3C78_1108300 [compost metagenome]